MKVKVTKIYNVTNITHEDYNKAFKTHTIRKAINDAINSYNRLVPLFDNEKRTLKNTLVDFICNTAQLELTFASNIDNNDTELSDAKLVNCLYELITANITESANETLFLYDTELTNNDSNYELILSTDIYKVFINKSIIYDVFKRDITM